MRSWLRKIYHKLVLINDSPKKIACGFACGVFWGIIPTFGLGVVISLGCALIFKFNKLAAVLGSMIMNPWTSPFFWGLSFVLGSLLLGYDYEAKKGVLASLIRGENIWANLKNELLWPYLCGNLILALFLSGIFYFFVLFLIGGYRRGVRS